MANINKRQLVYKQEIINTNLELDYLSEKTIDFDSFPSGDDYYMVKQQFIGRIDLISYDVYGTVDLWWLILLRNNIIDPINDIEVGDVLKIPSISDYYDYFNKNIKVSEQEDFISDVRVLD